MAVKKEKKQKKQEKKKKPSTKSTKPPQSPIDQIRRLTVKQKRFIEFFEGNATEAARAAGYKGGENVLCQVGRENLTKPHIRALIEEREHRKSSKKIATRSERQEFWTEVMTDAKNDMKHRLKASELLGKSQADFVDRVKFEADELDQLIESAFIQLSELESRKKLEN